MGDFANQVIVVAGTTGIGGATARRLAAAGARIVAVGRSRENAEALARTLAAEGHEVLPVAQDLSVDGAAEVVVAAALRKFGRIDALFHVAGISARKFGDGPLATCSDAGLDAVWRVNVRAMFQLNRACVRHWLAAGQPGVVLNMASVLGFAFAADRFDAVGYAMSKAAIIAMSQHSAATYARHRIRVNVIAPALVDTPMAERATRDPDILQFLRRKQPLTEAPLSDDDCAQAAVFLLGPAAATITGIVLPVDAGWCVSG